MQAQKMQVKKMIDKRLYLSFFLSFIRDGQQVWCIVRSLPSLAE
ncbi:hypothetical protein [Dickeya fangzhongdai]|nr:hypothetical protein [Dickeya fangzhongdai]